MKEIKIDKFNSPEIDTVRVLQKKYSVSIGNGTTHYFGSKRDSLAFLAETNRFLNSKMHELNFIYIDSWAKYRKTWAYFKHNKPTMSQSLTGKEQKCIEITKTIESTFNLCVNRSHYPNGNHFIFNWLNLISIKICEMVEILKTIHKSKSNAVDVYECEIILKRSNLVVNDLENYGKKTGVIEYKNKIIDFPLSVAK